MTVKFFIKPTRDSANSYPDDVEVKVDNEEIKFTLESPSRTIHLALDDIRAVLKATGK